MNDSINNILYLLERIDPQYRDYSLLTEGAESLSRLYENSSSNDITNDLKRYFQLCQLSDFGDANSSIEASKLHEKLMESLLLFHQNTDDRKIFARILSYMRNLFATKMKIKVTTNDNYEWHVEMEANDGSYNLDNTVIISSYNVENDKAFDEIVYTTHEGVIWEETEDTTDYNGRSVFNCSHARMSDEMKEKIHSMGLIPGICHWGSYHEDFVECVGVLPSMKKEAEKRGVNFKCCF